jgi:hypothetical protein
LQSLALPKLKAVVAAVATEVAADMLAQVGIQAQVTQQHQQKVLHRHQQKVLLRQAKVLQKVPAL